MKIKLLTILLLVCGPGVCFAQIVADLNGKWSCLLIAPDSEQYNVNYVFKIDGDKITGTMETAGITVRIDSGKVKGDSLFFGIVFQGKSFPHKGRYYAQGDSVAMNVYFEESNATAHTKLTRTP